MSGAKSEATLTCINPATEEVLAEFSCISSQQLESILALQIQGHAAWRRSGLDRRLQVIESIGLILTEQRETLAKDISLAMGKPLHESMQEIDKCVVACQFFAQHGGSLLAAATEALAVPQRLSPFRGRIAHFQLQPLGPILLIMPWNFPLWQVLRQALPNIILGNSLLLKHAPIVSGIALKIEQILQLALGGDFSHQFRTLLVEDWQISAIIADPRIRAVAFTGSSRVGRLVAEQAGRALKKCVLELGGSDAYVALEDADIDLVVNEVCKARFANAGQSCIAAKRLLVHENLVQPVMDGLQGKLNSMKLGDPLHPGTTMGPLARADLRDELLRQLAADHTLGPGGTLISAPGAVPEKGYFVKPTIKLDVAPSSPLWTEEVFGPVLAVRRFSTSDQALQLANGSKYGLGAAVFSQNPQQALDFAAEMQSGGTSINGAYHSDPRLPFGGTFESGFGRELGVAAFLEFANVKTIVVSLPDRVGK